MFCVQSFFTFVGIYTEAITRSYEDKIIYFIACCAFGLISWLIFLYMFDLVNDEDDEQEESKIDLLEEMEKEKAREEKVADFEPQFYPIMRE